MDEHDCHEDHYYGHEDHHHDNYQRFQECADACMEHSQEPGFIEAGLTIEGCMQHCHEFHPLPDE
ncbi:Hypothetical predicted protein [Mytilus galloprovincialis]|nr:Hypothetical predicted protein [Mytilus galloprovincialis]